MSKIIILLIFFSEFLYAQRPYSRAKNNNEIIVDFVNANIGKKVSYGICLDLVLEAAKPIYGEDSLLKYYFYSDKSVQKSCDFFNSHKVKHPFLIPGDIIEFFFDNGEQKHIGIVMEIKGDIIIYAEQNVGDLENSRRIEWRMGDMAPLVKDSNVILSRLDLKNNKGIIMFYRL